MIQRLRYLIIIQFLSLSIGQFGQNIVQYDDFSWHFIQSKHFDIYYSEDGRTHAEFTAIEGEAAYLKIADRLNWRLKNRVSIIVYNSHNDFQQTNVIDSYMYEGELYSKLITSSKAYSILKGLDECRYSSDIKTVAVQIKAKECLG